MWVFSAVFYFVTSWFNLFFTISFIWTGKGIWLKKNFIFVTSIGRADIYDIYWLQKSTAPSAVSRSLSVPGRNVVIVRSVSFAARKENSMTDSAEGSCSKSILCWIKLLRLHPQIIIWKRVKYQLASWTLRFGIWIIY